MFRVIFAFLLIIGVASAATYYVPDDYPTIQGAINACVDGDVVIVRPGVYVENIDFKGKAIHLKSESGPDVTIIDGNQAGSVVTFQSGEELDSVLEGFTLTNGSGFDTGGYYFGGGVYCFDSSPTIRNNTISSNSVIDYGGGIYCFGHSPAITNNFINGNTAGAGGGIYCASSSSNITNNIISGNTGGTGGGISLHASLSLTNNIIAWNSATFRAGAAYIKADVEVTNNILWGNSAPTAPGIHVGFFLYPSTVNVSFSDIEGGQSSCHVDGGSTLNWGPGMIDADPLFADPTNDDFHITWSSPCKDTGDNTAITEIYDFEGDPRIAGGTVDMGADEFYYHLYHIGDVVPGSPIDVKVIGPPTAPVTLALGAGIVDPPRVTPYGDLYLAFPLMQFKIGSLPSNGVLVRPSAVPFFWNPGEEKPLQALIGPLGNPNSVLTNLMTLTVE